MKLFEYKEKINFFYALYGIFFLYSCNGMDSECGNLFWDCMRNPTELKKYLDELGPYIILRNNEIDGLDKKIAAYKSNEKTLREDTESITKNIKNQTEVLENNKNTFEKINNKIPEQSIAIENNNTTFENINNKIPEQSIAIENNKNTFEKINNELPEQTIIIENNKNTFENIKKAIEKLNTDIITISEQWEKLKNIDTKELRSNLNYFEEKQPMLNLLLEKMDLIEHRTQFFKWLEELVKKDPEIITKILQYKKSQDIILTEENFNKKINKLENENYINKIILLATITSIVTYSCYKFVNYFFKKNSNKKVILKKRKISQ